MANRPYRMKDMKDIVRYIVQKDGYSQVKGKDFWVKLAESGQIKDRTWQSLKEVFLKRVYPDISNPYYELTASQKQMFKNGNSKKKENLIDWSHTPNKSAKSSKVSSTSASTSTSPSDSTSASTTPDRVEPRTLRPRLSQPEQQKKSVKKSNEDNLRKHSDSFSFDDSGDELNTQKFNLSITRGTVSTPKSSGKKPTQEKKTPVESNKTPKIDNNLQIDLTNTSDELNTSFIEDSAPENNEIDEEIPILTQESQKSITYDTKKYDNSKVAASKRNIFGMSSGKTTVVEINSSTNLKPKTPLKLSTPAKMNETITINDTIYDSDNSDQYVQLKTINLDGVAEPMYAVYKGKLHPLYAEKNKQKFKCFIKNKQIHFVKNDEPSSTVKFNEIKEKLLNIFNADSANKPTQLVNGDIEGSEYSAVPTKKYLKNPYHNSNSNLFSENPRKNNVDSSQKIVDFPSENLKLQYYSDLERYIENGCRGRKPMKEWYQKVLTESEKRTHKSYANLYKNEGLEAQKNHKDTQNVYELLNDVLLKEATNEEQDSELEKNEFLSKLRTLVEQLENRLKTPKRYVKQERPTSVHSLQAQTYSETEPTLQPQNKSPKRPLLKDSIKKSPKKVNLKISVDNEGDKELEQAFRLDTQNSNRLLYFIEKLHDKNKAQEQPKKKKESLSQKDEENLKTTKKESLIYKTMRVENQQKIDLDERNLFTKAEIELAKSSQKTPTTPYFVASDDKKNKNSNNAEKSSVISDMQKIFNQPKPSTESNKPDAKRSSITHKPDVNPSTDSNKKDVKPPTDNNNKPDAKPKNKLLKPSTSKKAKDNDEDDFEEKITRSKLKPRLSLRNHQEQKPNNTPVKTKPIAKSKKVSNSNSAKKSSEDSTIGDNDRFMLNPLFNSDVIADSQIPSPIPKSQSKIQKGLKIKLKENRGRKRLQTKTFISPPLKKRMRLNTLSPESTNFELIPFKRSSISYHEICPGFIGHQTMSFLDKQTNFTSFSFLNPSFLDNLNTNSLLNFRDLITRSNNNVQECDFTLGVKDMSLTKCVSESELNKVDYEEMYSQMKNDMLLSQNSLEDSLLTSDSSFIERNEKDNVD